MYSDKYPDFFARFYDLIYDQVRSFADHNYYLEKIRQVNGKILEIGVGTGRFFIDALNNGADIYGIDMSPSMLQVLKEKIDPAQYFRIQEADICHFKSDETYDLILAPFRVFSHLLTVEKQLEALNNIASMLNENGHFIFDLFVPNTEMIHKGLDQVVDFEGTHKPGKKVKRIIDMETDIIEQVSHINYRMVWEEEDKQYEKDWSFDFRFFFRFELEHLIQISKLKLVEIYGDFNENKVKKGDTEFIVVCTKDPDSM